MYTSAKPYFYGTGRRKKSVARVRIYPGSGEITINGRFPAIFIPLPLSAFFLLAIAMIAITNAIIAIIKP